MLFGKLLYAGLCLLCGAVLRSFAGAYDWADTSQRSFTPVVYFNDTFEIRDDGLHAGAKYTRKPQLLNMAVNSWLSNILGERATMVLGCITTACYSSSTKAA